MLRHKADRTVLYVVVTLCLSVGFIVYLAMFHSTKASDHNRSSEYRHTQSLTYQRRDNVKKGIMCTPKSCCKLVDAVDALQDNIEHEIEGKLDEDELQCVPLSWTPQPPTMFTIP